MTGTFLHAVLGLVHRGRNTIGRTKSAVTTSPVVDPILSNPSDTTFNGFEPNTSFGVNDSLSLSVLFSKHVPGAIPVVHSGVVWRGKYYLVVSLITFAYGSEIKIKNEII